MDGAEASLKRWFGAPLPGRPKIEAWSPILVRRWVRRSLRTGNFGYGQVIGHVGAVARRQVLPRRARRHIQLPGSSWRLTLSLPFHCVRHFLSATVRV